ncbi:hypothetical protein PoB_004671300 [Plakobranchus ocellatus]|uniref:Uncharacterized protein n=1 Tax=Plakobranchus ocellatus TaxID=259542 RepID=A0AAV4BM22_9GAST|nr:hypothetical protein PoB_004671300 [Plakobranchus ocellatus]
MVCTEATNCKFFVKERGKRSSCRTDPPHGWSATTVCRLCKEREKTVLHVLSEYRELANVHLSGWANMFLNDIFWRQDRVAISMTANMIQGFFRRAL